MSIQKTSIDFGLSIQIEKIFQGLSLEKSTIEKGIAMIFSGGCGTYFGKPGITGFLSNFFIPTLEVFYCYFLELPNLKIRTFRIICVYILNQMSFSLDRLVTKNQWLNTKYELKFLLVFPFENKRLSLSSFWKETV